MADPRAPDPRNVDPTAPHAPYSDPAADPLLTDHRPVTRGGSRGGLIAAGVIAVLLVVALIAFSSGTTTDPGTTAVIPDQTEDAMPAPAPEAAPEAPLAPAPAEEAPGADQ